MFPARKQSSQKRRKIQDDLRAFFGGPAVAASRQPNRITGPGVVVLFFTLIFGCMYGYYSYLAYRGDVAQFQAFKEFLVAVSQPPVPFEIERTSGGDWQSQVEPVFNPQPRLSQDQMANYELVATIPNNPERFEATAVKPSLGFTPAMMEILFANTLSESSFRHLDLVSQTLNTSSKGCVGLMQGCNDICTPEEWGQIHTNVWCGAATFKWFWEQVGVDQNPMLVHYALAGYKGGFTSYDSDGDGVEDAWVRDEVTGLPTINAEGAEGARIAESYLLWLPR